MTKGISGNSKKFHKWKIGQINIQSCSDDHKLHRALHECARANLDVVCFQEVRLLNSGAITHNGYNFYWNGMQRFKRYGVAIAIRNNPNIVINSIYNSTPRLMAADLTIKGCKLRIISCYAPTLQGSSMATKQQFYRELSKLLKVEKHRKILINGDFNAEPDFCRRHSRFEGGKTFFDNGSDLTNENNMLFLQYCHTNQLAIMNTWFDHPVHHRETWHHPNGTTRKVYDYCLAEPWLSQYITDVRVRNSYFHSDHRLVVTKLNTPANKVARRFIKRKSPTIKPNMQLLQNDNIKDRVTESIQYHLEQNELPTSIDEMHSHIIEALTKGRQQIPPKQRNNRQTTQISNDNALNELHQIRIDLRKKQPTNNVKKNLKDVAKKIKDKVKELQSWKTKANQ